MPKKLTAKSICSTALIVLSIPILVFLSKFMGPRKYYLISLMVALLAIAVFFLSFENRRPQAKELIVIAVMSAIAAVARTAFIWIPFFKPLAAVIIICGAALGAQAGFLCGALSVFASNFVFGQGPWTPWQMIAFGMCGFFAGLLFYKNQKKRTPKRMAVYGGCAIMFLTGPILDFSTLMSHTQLPDLAGIAAVFAAGASVNLVQAAATVIFLLIAARPMLEKLDRMKVKYGMMN